ncbi:hypothetical protein M408DRAFT_328875 [Serendipita vermifera MAFF 305830]|uniref:Cathepsin propeptide inhibitor domain-containing protein n=1 Tax=Serendipita vermifera MAFF 305830 TaxID=933852 RepID=A0A0C3BCN4_SERVB|nr:hypothetical protein M408DRAFT_328875 [Serendipita vermifera MAFF 305830]
MRVSFLILSVVAVVPALAAPIDPIHYEELEARWNPFKKINLKKAFSTASNIYREASKVYNTAAPIAKKFGVIKREEMEDELYRREWDDAEFDKREFEDLEALD